MTKDAARKAIENKGYKVTWDMSAQMFLATPKSSLYGRYTKAETLNGLYNKVK